MKFTNREIVLISLAASVSALVTFDAGPAQADQDKQLSLSQLGPNPFYGLPDTLEAVVNGVPAAIVAQIVGPGTLQLEEVSVPGFSRRRVEGYATYRVIIRNVVFHRQPESTPPLVVGSQREFRQRVGRESAEAFVANRIPVAADDECLLFLWLRPHGWEILNWHLQFRRSRELPSKAEMLADSRAFKLRPEWFGGSVPATTAGEVVMPDWDGLVAEVRRLGRQPIAQ